MAAVTIWSGFGAPQNSILYFFHFLHFKTFFFFTVRSFILFVLVSRRGMRASHSQFLNNCDHPPPLLSEINWKDVIQFSSVTQSCPTFCNPMNRSMPGLPVHHQLPEFTQTHVHRVKDAIQPSHPRSSPFPPAPNPSHHQSLFKLVNSSHEVAKVLELQL